VEPPALRVLTFEVGPYLFAVQASVVGRILPPGAHPPEGTTVVDAVGLLREERGAGPTGAECLLLLTGSAPDGPPLAVRASRAAEVRPLRPEGLLPLPGYIFRQANPFLGLVPPGASEASRALFVLAGPERLLACAGDP
jgi:hypothetical protein